MYSFFNYLIKLFGHSSSSNINIAHILAPATPKALPINPKIPANTLIPPPFDIFYNYHKSYQIFYMR